MTGQLAVEAATRHGSLSKVFVYNGNDLPKTHPHSLGLEGFEDLQWWEASQQAEFAQKAAAQPRGCAVPPLGLKVTVLNERLLYDELP